MKTSIQGFEETDAGANPAAAWQPFSERRVRVGIVGEGFCSFGSQFGYPTHSNGFYTCVTHKRFVEVACSAVPSIKTRYQPGRNRYANPYGSEFATMRCEDGSTARMLVAWDVPSFGGKIGRIFGNKGCYVPEKGGYRGWFDVEVAKMDLAKPALPSGVEPGGHGGSHAYLTDDFLRGILVPGHKVCVDLRTALDTTLAGVYAHLSAMKGGELMKVPESGA